MRVPHRAWSTLALVALVPNCSESDAGAPRGSAGRAGSGAATASGGNDSGGGAGTGGVSGSGAQPSGGAGSGAVSGGGSGGSMPDAGLSGELNLYWVDVEGGAATIIHAPSGQVVLVDTGNPGGRDAARILNVLSGEVGATSLAHLIITHYHVDHVGGAEEVAAAIDVQQFVDHGSSVESGSGQDYPALAEGRRRSVVPGDTLALGALSLTVVAAHGQVLQSALGASTPNALCDDADPGTKNPGDENAMSVGYVLEFGSFQFLDLGDLLWGYEHELACPVNKIGEVDLLQVPHHGLAVSSPPQLLHALRPLVAITSNGPTKGNAESTFDTLMGVPGIQAIWNIHRSENNDDAHNPPEERIANVVSGSGDAAHFIHARVLPDGSFTVRNVRNGATQTYQAR